MPRDAAEVGVEESRAAWAEAARPILIEVAQHYHAVITYKDLATEVQRVTGIQGSQQMHYWIGDVLSRVSRDAFSRGEPLLSALCVKADGTRRRAVRRRRGRDHRRPDRGRRRPRGRCSGWRATATSRRPTCPPTAARRP